MQNLSDIKTVKKILSSHGFSFSKAMGQNFLIDSSVCPRMAELSGIDKSCGVIEIGPGIGVLTAELAKRAGKVVAIELDKRLGPVLEETLSDFDNVKIIFGDCLKIDLKKLIFEEFGGGRLAVCANLPYYITSPVIMKLLESGLPVESITAMVQKEAGERLSAEVGTRQSGAVTVAVNYYSSAEILFDVGRESFMPSPNVDSCVIKLSLRDKPEYECDEKTLFSIVKSGFSQRRKTVSNSLMSGAGLGRENLMTAISKADINPSARIEQLTMEQLCLLADKISEERKNVIG